VPRILPQLRKRLIAFSHDLLMIPIAWLGAYWLRFNLSEIPHAVLLHALAILPIVVTMQVIVYWSFGLYRGVWRFASVPDLIRIIKAVLIGTASIGISLFLITRLNNIPRSIFPLYALLLLIALGGSRFIYRWLKDKTLSDSGKRVLIVGAGRGGEGIVRDLLRMQKRAYLPVAFVDDGHDKQGREIHGIRVVGSTAAIAKIVERFSIELIIIAVPSANAASMRRIVAHCEAAQIPYRTLPSLNDLTSGRVSIENLRSVSLEDLLGRDPVTLDWDKISSGIHKKIVLVTGGGGSIGAELCRQIAKFNPKKLVVIEQSEFNLYSLGLELEKTFPQLNFEGCLLDVTDRLAIQEVMNKYSFDTIFHAAAYKHVPMLETHLRIAVMNNIIGTRIVAEEAVANNVKTFVLISTDKAVNPTNVMGASKRAAEMFCQNLNAQANTQFITVRFGNVLGSAGSVVPLFSQQIKQGGPVTVTHPQITRFFMTIPEATQLILQTTIMGNGGEIFVLDMGEPVKISYLAEQMIQLSGFKLHEDIEIVYVGLRPGEKLREELFHKSETLIGTTHEKILKANYRNMEWSQLINIINNLEQACYNNDVSALRILLKELVPEYSPEPAAQTSHSMEYNV